MKKAILSSIALVAAVLSGHAQLGSLCNNAQPACAQTGLTYTNSTGQAPGHPGMGAVNCLSTTPNAAIFYMQVGTSGNINMTLRQTNNSGTGIDVDFQLWGPFPSLAAGCASIANNPANANAGCSYSTAFTEYVNIVNGTVGSYYILLITNYSNQPGTVSLTQTGGSGTTNCGILSNAQNNGPICLGQPLTLTGTGSSGSASYSSTWYAGTNYSAPLSNSLTYTFTPPSAGSYDFTLVITDLNSLQSDTSHTTAVVNPIPAAPVFTSTSPACQGSLVTLTPTPTIPGATYTWSGTNGFTSNVPVVNFPGAIPAIFNGDYTLRVSVNGCLSPPYTQNLTVYPTVVPIVTGPTEVCEGAYVPLSVTNGNAFVSFTWNSTTGLPSPGPGSNPQPVTNGSYTVSVVDSHGCTTVSTPAHIVTLLPNPLEFFGTPSLCTGSTTVLRATPGKASYLWNTGSTVDSTVVSHGGPLILTVVSTQGCERTDTVDITEHAKPVAAVSPDKICGGDLVNFQNNTQLSDNFGSVQQSWFWNFGHLNPDSTQAVSSLSAPAHLFPGPGAYHVTFRVESNYGCSDTVEYTFHVIDNPHPSFVFESLCFGESKFTNTSHQGSNPFKTTNWDFGDGTTSTTTDPVFSHGFPSIAAYDVTLTITDSMGCVSDTLIPILLKPTPMFGEIPNIITPNGDNVNDDYVFLPIYEDCYNYTFAVFNRWGAKVFETEKSSKGFNGISGLGSKLKDGVYFWVLTANGIVQGEGEKILKKGTLTVVGTK